MYTENNVVILTTLRHNLHPEYYFSILTFSRIHRILLTTQKLMLIQTDYQAEYYNILLKISTLRLTGDKHKNILIKNNSILKIKIAAEK